MEDWQARVIKERDELKTKMAKIDVFIDGPKYDGIDGVQQDLLDEQRIAMDVYREVLDRRIDRFRQTGEDT